MSRQSARSGLRPDRKNHRNFPQPRGIIVVVSGEVYLSLHARVHLRVITGDNALQNASPAKRSFPTTGFRELPPPGLGVWGRSKLKEIPYLSAKIYPLRPAFGEFGPPGITGWHWRDTSSRRKTRLAGIRRG
jgi:hypothetical protein